MTTTDRERLGAPDGASGRAAADDDDVDVDVDGSEPVPAVAHAVRRLSPGRRSLVTDLGELWAASELVAFLAVRDLKVRYKQTALGAVWAVLQPAATMAVFYVFFRKLSDAPGG